MKNRKKLIATAKSLYKKSLKDGVVNTQKVRQIAAKLATLRKPGVSTILKVYKRLIEQAITKEEVIVETAVPIASFKKFEDELLTRTGARRIKYKINPRVVFGAKITHGDWIYDATLDAKLKRLTNAQWLKTTAKAIVFRRWSFSKTWVSLKK